MKKIMLLAAAAIPAIAIAQSGTNVALMSERDLRGTARYMAMGGAFTALGGDLSTLGLNPAGIGIYRSSEIGITADLNFQSFGTTAPSVSSTVNQTRFNINNLGYVGTINLYDEAVPTFSVGATFQRVNSFDRVVKGNGLGLGGSSLSNYVAAFTNGMGVNGDGFSPFSHKNFEWTNSYNPYLDTPPSGIYPPWMTVLAYKSLMINENQQNSQGNIMFQGLMGDGSTGRADFETREKGSIDEYNITFGGNIYNVLYWGLGFGITDVDYTQWSYYRENIQNAYFESTMKGRPSDEWYKDVRGNADYALTNYLRTTGSGLNLKLGVILKPIQELRFGIAFHSPTWYSMTDTYWGAVDYKYTPTDLNTYDPANGNALTNDSENNVYDYRMTTPWLLTAGVAGVIDNSFIISADYEYRGNNMRVANVNDDEFADVTNQVDTYYKGVNTVRLGGEYRVTPQFSLRAGYSYETSPVQTRAANDGDNILFSGTIPSYSFNKTTSYYTAGAGYRTGSWSFDFAFVNRHRESTWHAFSPIVVDGGTLLESSPQASVTSDYNQAVLSVSYRF